MSSSGYKETSSEDMEMASSIRGAWARFLAGRFGRWLEEHTAIVENLSRGGDRAVRTLWGVVFIPALLLLLAALVLHSAFLLVLTLVALPFVAAGVWVFWKSYDRSDQQDADRFDTDRHLLGRRGARLRLSGWSLSKAADSALPETRARLDSSPSTKGKPISPRGLGIKLGYCHGVDVWLSAERPVYVLAPTRSGKTTRLVIPSVMEAPGPVVTTSSRRDVIDQTFRYRRDGFVTEGREDYGGGAPRHRPGRVYVFDPLNILHDDPEFAPFRIHWNPVKGCRDIAKARSMATALVGSGDLGEENRVWQHTGVDIAQALLVAADIKGFGLDKVYEWSQGRDGINVAMNILMKEKDPAYHACAGPLSQLNADDQRTMSNKFLTISSSFSALSLPEVRAWFRPYGEDFDVREFLKSNGTVYMLGDLRPVSNQASASTAVFNSMFLAEVRDAARALAAESSFGKLDPPVTFVLDEVANITPWDGLPQLDTAGTGDGIWPIQIFQSREQARAAFKGEEGQMWDNSQKVLLGGQSSMNVLKELSTLSGEYSRTSMETSWRGTDLFKFPDLNSIQSSERREDRPALSVDDIRRIPMDRALLVSGSNPVAAVRLIPYWKRGWRAMDGREALGR